MSAERVRTIARRLRTERLAARDESLDHETVEGLAALYVAQTGALPTVSALAGGE